MDEFGIWMREIGLSAATAEAYMGIAAKYSAWLASRRKRPQEASYPTLLEYARLLQARGLSKRTANGELAAIRRYYAWLEHLGEVSESPAEGLYIRNAGRRLPHGLLSAEELDALWQAYPSDTPARRRDRLALSMLCQQGIAPTEAAALRIGDIDMAGGQLTVRADRLAGRTLRLEPMQLEMLRAHIAEWKPETHLFASSTGGDYAGVLPDMAHGLRQSGRLHSIRQPRASRIAVWAKSLGLRRAQYLAGHRHPSSTERYMRADPEDLKRAVERSHPLDRP